MACSTCPGRLTRLVDWRLALCAVCASLATLLAYGCSRSSTAATVQDENASAPVPVVVATAVEQDVPIEVQGIGTVQPYATVAIRSRVSGQVSAVHFQEGQEVKAGGPLFTIDPRPFEAELRQAEANLSSSQAAARDAGRFAQRQQELYQQKLVAASDYDKAHFAAAVTEGKASADRAAVQNAQLQLSYTAIHSPIDGRTGNVLLNLGNVVKNDDTVLLNINQIHPIYVSFSVPEQFLGQIQAAMAERKLPVRATIQSSSPQAQPARGVLTFVDNQVDSSTGTIQLKATFQNDDRRLWPGQFVHAALVLAQQPHAVLVPSQAVQTGQNGQYVWVISSDGTARLQPVKLDRSLDGQTVIASGVTPGERVVTDGQLRLVQGAKVAIQDRPVGGEASPP